VSARKIASSSAPFDDVGGRPRFHNASHASDWAHLRLEFAARSMCESIAVWGQEMARLDNERSPTALAHESARAQRMVDFFEDHVTDPLMQGGMAHLILAVYTTIRTVANVVRHVEVERVALCHRRESGIGKLIIRTIPRATMGSDRTVGRIGHEAWIWRCTGATACSAAQRSRCSGTA
jgi:hypothetical protein